jgi:hypothetical protein
MPTRIRLPSIVTRRREAKHARTRGSWSSNPPPPEGTLAYEPQHSDTQHSDTQQSGAPHFDPQHLNARSEDARGDGTPPGYDPPGYDAPGYEALEVGSRGHDPAEAHDWLDEDAGPVVRPYTMTGGRSRPVTSGLSLLTYVEALYAPEADLIHLQPEHRSILVMTRTALSIAEIAGRLDLPVGVVRVLVGDLLQASLVSTFDSDASINPPDESILQAVIDGLRAL